jgi:hypothetical protein
MANTAVRWSSPFFRHFSLSFALQPCYNPNEIQTQPRRFRRKTQDAPGEPY